MKTKPLLLIIFLAFNIAVNAQPSNNNSFIRGDAKIEFRWRNGYDEYGGDFKSTFNQEEVTRGTQAWVDGFNWAADYKDWNDSILYGVQLLFRGGSPYARALRCVSDLVPVTRAGLPVTFAIPLQVCIGSEEYVSVALKVSGQDEEIVSFTFSPQKKVEITGGQLKIDFYTLKLYEPLVKSPGMALIGMLHVRVYPGLINYGGRMTFEFSSNTKHMDKESGFSIGSLWKDVSQTDVAAAWHKSGLSEEKLEKAAEIQRIQLQDWNARSRKMSDDLSVPGKIVISCSETPKAYDRGEGRVQAYSGNPVKDFQSGTPSGKMIGMSTAVAEQMGKKFSIFRYQHRHMLWEANNPEKLNPEELGYFDQWMLAAKASSDAVILDLQISPFTQAYKAFTKMGTLPLPSEGVPGYTWDKLVIGYIFAIRHAKEVCPQLSIVQMPYEFDNINNTEYHRDAHYQLLKVVYRAVNEVNKKLASNQQIKVAGLGVNTPDGRWEFINGFLKRYAADTDPTKRLDYLTWHTYLFPPFDYPNITKGFQAKLQELLAKHHLPLNLPVIVDELGLAEPSTIEDLSDLLGAARKEAAMACFTASIHNWNLAENGNFIPITGAGWHFGMLTYGKQNAMSPYAKGMILRSRLADGMIPSTSTPQDNKGYGLYSLATRDDKKISVLVWSASPAVFLSNAHSLSYPKTEVVFNDLPVNLQNRLLKVSIQSMSPDDAAIQLILGQNKCQTLPLTRGADRY
ncbi:MAG: hypothetical protein M0R39_07310, partial [Prolixibacteraceae bacterium]|nr:hypothetical protein [Prolixibacteraceae bacterium]